MTRHLTGRAPCLPPPAASAMYARAFEALHWTVEVKAKVARQMRGLWQDFQHTGKPDREWDSPDYEMRGERLVAVGNCNDAAPMLKRSLVAVGLPEPALRLVLCKRSGEGHLVLAIETDAGTMICDWPLGCWPVDDPKWQGYEWLAAEDAGRPWVSLEAPKPVSLADVLGK